MLYIPNSMAGTSASTTRLMIRFESMASWMETPLLEVSLET